MTPIATGPRPPGRGSLALLAVVLFVILEQATGQQVCDQTQTRQCPDGYVCAANSLCEEITGSGMGDTTTYIILGVVLAGIVIIVAAILIIYFGRWTWLQRLKDRAAGPQRTKQEFPPRPVPLPGGPLLFQQPKRPTFGRRLKLRLQGVTRTPSPYMGSTTPYMTPAQQPSPLMGRTSPYLIPGLQQPSPFMASPAPSLIGGNALGIPSMPASQSIGMDSNTTYVIGHGGSGDNQNRSGPFVASLNMDSPPSTVPALEYPSGGGPRPGEQVVQVGGMAQSNAAFPHRCTPPPSPQPHQHSYQYPPYQHQAHSHAVVPHSHNAVVPHSHNADVVPHTHPLYPNLDGHTHSVGPPSYLEAQRKV